MGLEIGDRIKSLRERKDWSQTELAKRLGISKSVMSRIEAGKRPIEDSLLLILSRVLDVSADYLLGLKILSSGSAQMDDVDKAFVEEYMNMDKKEKERFRKIAGVIKE